jgi:hypothetical protein
MPGCGLFAVNAAHHTIALGHRAWHHLAPRLSEGMLTGKLRVGKLRASDPENSVASICNNMRRNIVSFDKKYLVWALGYIAIGMCLGIFMAATQKHGQLPTHAHINLIGFVLSLSDLPSVFRLPRGGFHATSFSCC